jgi:hypothetical protein
VLPAKKKLLAVPASASVIQNNMPLLPNKNNLLAVPASAAALPTTKKHAVLNFAVVISVKRKTHAVLASATLVPAKKKQITHYWPSPPPTPCSPPKNCRPRRRRRGPHPKYNHAIPSSAAVVPAKRKFIDHTNTYFFHQPP